MAGPSVGAIIDGLESQFPGMKDRLMDESGELRYFVNIYLNGEDVRFLEGTGTGTKEGDEISIVPAVAGG
jgi:molybdopterin synthase sulfur carrier subunit